MPVILTLQVLALVVSEEFKVVSVRLRNSLKTDRPFLDDDVRTRGLIKQWWGHVLGCCCPILGMCRV